MSRSTGSSPPTTNRKKRKKRKSWKRNFPMPQAQAAAAAVALVEDAVGPKAVPEVEEE
jgi:hypothetical protein